MLDIYIVIQEDTKEFNVEWVPKARWVVNDDMHIWTASGVTAGMCDFSRIMVLATLLIPSC